MDQVLDLHALAPVPTTDGAAEVEPGMGVGGERREVALAEHGMEKWIAEVRRTPEEMFDKMIENFQSGYAARMGVSEQ